MTKSIDNQVHDIVKDSYNNIEDDVKKALLDKINLQTIDDIKKLAAAWEIERIIKAAKGGN